MNTFKMQCINYLLVNEWYQEIDESWGNNKLRQYGCTMYDALESQIEHDENAEANEYPE